MKYGIGLACIIIVGIGVGLAVRKPSPPANRASAETATRPVSPLSAEERAVFEKPSDSELQQQLTDVQFAVTQREDTEPPFANEYWDNKQAGIYVDIVSGEPLFSSLDKFDSGTGWPSFTQPLVSENLEKRIDEGWLYPRTEVHSRRAKSHLGHVFDDGPAPTGLRYCINSAALRFVGVDALEKEGYAEFLPLFSDKK